MRTRTLFHQLLGLVLLGSLPVGAATYPIDLSGELDVSSDDAAASAPAVGHGGHGRFVIAWRARAAGGDSIQARVLQRVGSAIEIAPPFIVRTAVAGVTLSAPGVAMDAAGRFTIAWGEGRATESCVGLRRFGARGQPLVSPSVEGCQPASSSPVEAPQVAAGANAGGEVAIVWTRRTAAANQHVLRLRTLSPTGVLRAVATVASQAGSDPGPRVAVGGGQVFVVWSNPAATLRRFSIAGAPLGSAGPLPAYGGHDPAVASNRNGQFASVWAEGGATDGSSFIGGWIFNADGSRMPRGFLDPLDYDALFPDGDVFNPDIAADRVGGLAFLWESELYDAEATAIVGRIYNSLGDELSPIFRLNTEEAGAQKHPAVTLADDGDFLVAWETPPAGGDTEQHVHAALFHMPHDDDPCVYRGNTFLCELLGNFILAAPIQFGTGIANGDVPLLGDLDGDGRADPCLRRGGQFLCDLAHDGGAAEKKITFGPAGAPAFLADVDGNGSADPCVRTGRTFLCDTAHNGGAAELREDFGLATDLPVMGDVDGSGRADICVFRTASKSFLCDTAHDGTLGLTYAVNAKPGDRPLLGDVDGDGRADFCLARGAKLFCDRHTGVLEFRSLSTRLKDWLLLGNVDGM